MATAEQSLRDRAQMVQSIDRMVTKLLERVPENTYVVLTSDNGFHLGQHGLGMGKGAAYDSDIRVPLLVVGPGVRPGERPEVVSNIDLASDLRGPRRDPARRRTGPGPRWSRPSTTRPCSGTGYAFVEHTLVRLRRRPRRGRRRAPAWSRRTSPCAAASAVLIRTDLDNDPDDVHHVYEFYEYGDVGYERTNTYAAPHDRAELRRLKRKLRAYDACSVAVHDDAVPRECRDLRE